MPYLLDTNTCIAYINQSSPNVSKQLFAQASGDVFICDIVKYELYYGAYKSVRTSRNLETLSALFEEFASFPFDSNAARICGATRADLKSKGNPIGVYDLQIAAITISNGLTLVTHNTKEFQRVPGLTLVDWL